MQVHFVLLSRSGKERVIARPLPLLVGRDEEAGLRLPRDSVSRRHCEFLCRDGGVVVRDLGSTNGTLLGARPIEPHRDVPVAAGAVITIGGIKLRIDYDTARAGPPPAAAAPPDAPAADTRPDDSQTVFTPEADEPILLEEPDAGPVPAAAAPAADAHRPADGVPAADDVPAEGAAFAELDLEVAEEPADAGDFGFLAAEPAADVPADEWPDVAPPAAAPDDEDLDDFFKSLA